MCGQALAGRSRDVLSCSGVCLRVLAGDAAAGLAGLNGSVSSPSAVWMWVVVTEVMLLAGSVLLLKLVVDRWGTGAAAWHGESR